jgi:ABC-type amino acid transport substrate-binding protein
LPRRRNDEYADGWDRNYNPIKPEKRKRKPAVLALTLIAIIVLGIFAYQTSVKAWVPAPRGYLVIGTNTPFAPFEVQGSDGTIVGFDMDMAQAIATRMNVQLKIVDYSDFLALLPAVDAGTVDIAISAITITPQRSEVYNFSESYYNSSQAVLVRSGSALTCNTVATGGSVCAPSNFAGFSIAYQTQTTSESWVLNNLIGKVAIKGNVSLADFTSVLTLLKGGQVDSVIVDKPVADLIAKQDNSLKVAGDIPTGGQYGIAVHGGDPQHLLPIINSVITQMLNNGQYQQEIQKWFT